MKLRILRSVYVAGSVAAAGSVIDIDDRPLAGELLAFGKAERVEDAPPEGPMTTKSAPAAVAGKLGKKG